MHRLVEFIRSIYVVVLFVLLEAWGISHYARSTQYTRARLLSKATQVVGEGESAFARVKRYFRLERENRELIAYTSSLQERLAAYEGAELLAADPAIGREAPDTSWPEDVPDSLLAASEAALRQLLADKQYRTMTATVISNSINKQIGRAHV